MKIRQITPAIGAEISGVNLGVAARDPALFAEIRAALLKHRVLFFRKQEITRADHVAFASGFGKLEDHPVVGSVPEHPGLVKVYRSDNPHSFENSYHCDGLWRPNPAMGAVLRCIECPEIGGDTIWANSALAYTMLSDGMRKLVEGLRVHMSMRDVLKSSHENVEPRDSPIGRLAATRGTDLSPELAAKVHGSFHPLVRTHPETGERALYCDSSYAIGIEGLRPEESAPLLRFLAEHISQPAFTCRLRWEPKTLTLWDNRLCVHQAFNDYDGYRREMYRTTIAGEVPR